MLITVLKKRKVFGTQMLLALHNDLHVVLLEFYRTVSKLATIPATSCSAECSFTEMCRMKTYFCSTMGQERLTKTAMKNVERKYCNEMLKYDVKKIIDA